MRSRPLETTLTAFLEEAAVHLDAQTAAGAEVAFEVVAQPSRLHRTPLYCYRPLTTQFIHDRFEALTTLPEHDAAVAALAPLEGLERYLLARGAAHIPADADERARAALRALLDDVFDEQTDFALRPERVGEALRRLEESAVAGADEVTVLATLHGLAMAAAELPLVGGLAIAQPDAVRGVPDEALAGGSEGPGPPHLLVLLTSDEIDPARAVAHGREVLAELLRALRLFGDGRVTLGALGWVRVGTGNWRPLALGGGGRPRGMLVVAPEQEDELRAFCNLVSRRAPHDNEIAWALARYEMGCERPSDHDALTDYLLALRALLEPEGPASGLLPGRLAALCAVPERRVELTARVAHAITLERAIVAGTVADHSGGDAALVRAVADHLRALLRDVICGHLDPDLPTVADELLAPPEPAERSQPEKRSQPGQSEDEEVTAGGPAAAGQTEFWDYAPEEEPHGEDEPTQDAVVARKAAPPRRRAAKRAAPDDALTR